MLQQAGEGRNYLMKFATLHHEEKNTQNIMSITFCLSDPTSLFSGMQWQNFN